MSKLHFVVPVRHPQSVPDWSVVKRQLAETAMSISLQDHAGWTCHVVANHEADLPSLPDDFVVHRVDLTLPVMPDRHRETEAFYDAVRRDKGLRILAAVEDLPDDEFYMVVDFDDFVSRRLAGLVSSQPKANGWYVKDGYVFSGGNLVYKHKALDTFCGSTLVIRRGLLGSFRTNESEIDIAKVKRHLGSHVFIKPDLAALGVKLVPTPFPGTVYRVGNPQSTSGAGQLLDEMTPKWMAKKEPLRFASRLLQYRLVTKSMRSEFSLP